MLMCPLEEFVSKHLDDENQQPYNRLQLVKN